jgi:hypothetical protein
MALSKEDWIRTALEGIFREIGFPPGESRQRARIAYSTFLGWFELRRVVPHRTKVGRERAAYERAVPELLLAGAREANPPNTTSVSR